MSSSLDITTPTRSPFARSVDFVVAGGEGVGWGHLSRCAVLASEANRRGWRVRTFLRGDRAAANQWQQLTGVEISGPWAAWHPVGARGIVVLDFPEGPRRDGHDTKSEWLDRLEKHHQRVLLVDDPRSHPAIGWTLLPALHHAMSRELTHRGANAPESDQQPAVDRTPRGTYPSSPVLGAPMIGPRFALLSRAHLNRAPIALDRRNRVLLSMGGSDPHSFTPRVARALAVALRRHSVRHLIRGVDVVLGGGFSDPQGRESDMMRSLGFQVHQAVNAEAMAELMHHARLALMGFGVSLSELAWHQTPFLSIPHHASDRAPARDLAANGIGRLLTRSNTLNEESMADRIEAALMDHEWQRTSTALASAAIEGGQGAERVLSRIERELDNLTRKATRPESVQGCGIAKPAAGFAP